MLANPVYDTIFAWTCSDQNRNNGTIEAQSCFGYTGFIAGVFFCYRHLEDKQPQAARISEGHTIVLTFYFLLFLLH